MFRPPSINMNSNIEIKIELYRNRYEKIGIIPLDCVERFKYKHNDIDEFDIAISKFITRNGKQIINPIYNKIITRQQVIVTTLNKGEVVSEQRFTLCNRKRSGSKYKGSKTFTAKSWEQTIDRQRLDVPALTRPLIRESVETTEGILELIAREIGWKVGFVDEDAKKKEMSCIDSKNINLFKNFANNKVEESKVIWEKDVNIPLPEGKPLFVSLSYNKLITFDEKGLKLKEEEILNNIDTALHQTVIKIQAIHLSEAGNRYGILYKFYHNDNTVTEVKSVFTNVVNKKITCDNISVIYDYGETIKKYNTQYYNFEAFNDSAYKYLMDLQDIFECIFVFDTMENTINAYAWKNLNNYSDYLLSLDTNIVSIESQESETIPTGFKVIGRDETISISSENIEGTGDIIHNYSYYINNGLMSESLQSALVIYNDLLKKKQEEWYTIGNNLSVKRQQYTRLQSENLSLTARIKNLTNILSAYIAEKDEANQLRIKTEIEALEVRNTEVLRLMSGLDSEIKSLQEEMASISASIKKENAKKDNGEKIFTQDNLQELIDVEEIEEYNNDYNYIPLALYESAKKALEDKVKPQYDFKIDCKDLCSIIKNNKGWVHTLTLGNLFYIDNDELIKEISSNELRLSEIELVPIKGENRVKAENLIFTNKIHKFNKLKNMANLGRSTNKSDGAINSFRHNWEISTTTNNFVSNLIETGLDINASNIKGGVYRNVLDFSEAGCFFINDDKGNRDNQVYIGGGTVCITTDSWKHSKLALDSSGVIAQTLVGKAILGEKLIITTDDGQFSIGLNEDKTRMGLQVKDSNLKDRIFLGLEKDKTTGLQVAKLELKSADGREVVLDENGIINHNEFNVYDNISPEADCEMTIPIKIPQGTMSIKQCIVTLFPEKYRLWSRGASSGGGASTTTENGGSYSDTNTAESGGEHKHLMFVSNEYNCPTDDILTAEEYTCSGERWGADGSSTIRGIFFPSIMQSGQLAPKYLYTYGNSDKHSHPVRVNIPSHFHNFKIDNHEHQDIIGIRTINSVPTNIRVVVNGKQVANNINAYGHEVDITQYIDIKNPNNIIKIYSATHGRLTVNIFEKRFINY